jgi:hypothetical protein
VNRVLDVTVLVDGVPIGNAIFAPPDGLAWARLEPAWGYERVRNEAQACGLAFARTQFWSAIDGDFADAAAAPWRGRISLRDAYGRVLALSNIMVLERPAPEEATEATPAIIILADFRPDAARTHAFLKLLDGGSHGRARPAA